MLEINRTADYVVLWKSHRRAERAAEGLARQAAELRGLLAASGLPELAVTAPAAAIESLPGVTVGAAVAARPAAAIESLPGVTVAAPAAEPASVGAAVVDVDGMAARAEAEFLEAESGRMWELYAELGAELAQVAGLLTAAQRQTAEKVIQEWEAVGAG